MPKYAQQGVDRVFSAMETNLVTQITAVEVQESLTAGDLRGSSFIFIKAHVPNDNRSPLIRVFLEDWEMIDQNNRVAVVIVNVTFVYKADSDLEAGELYVNRIVTAINQVITGNKALAVPGIVGAIIIGGDADDDSADESSTKMARTVLLSVRVHSPD